MDSWHSYPKIFALGHKAVEDIFREPVIVEEKVDGSQFSFGRFGEELLIRSKGCVMNIAAPEKMFNHAAEMVRAMGSALHDGWTYRGEYLAKPKHNALAYDRIPRLHVMLFDISTGHEAYLSADAKREEAERLGFEVVPLLFEGMVSELAFFRSFLDRTSALGGQKIEGVVVKNYQRFTFDGKAMFGKFVSEAFKEVHGASWKEENPSQHDIIERIVDKVRTPARWAKAVQHLREAGKIEDTPRDIGELIKEVRRDVRGECHGEIADLVMRWALPQIERGMIRGLPEWYKDELLKKQFDTPGG